MKGNLQDFCLIMSLILTGLHLEEPLMSTCNCLNPILSLRFLKQQLIQYCQEKAGKYFYCFERK